MRNLSTAAFTATRFAIPMFAYSTGSRRWAFSASALLGVAAQLALFAPATSVAADDLAAGPRALSQAFRGAARSATPSVVTIIVSGQSELQTTNPLDGFSPIEPDRERDNAELPPTGLGSGVIIDASGVVLTNHHVVRNAARVVVKLQDGTELEASEVVGDADSDIATLKIHSPRPLVAAVLGDSDAMDIGDWVLAIGSPFNLEATVSAGIISAKGRTIPGIRRAELLQTDAVINPGNSGGPLINIDGQVIGISTAIATRNGAFQGIGFAIPVDQANWIADELLAHGKVRRAKIGISLAQLSRQFAEPLGLEPLEGVVAYQVTRESAADQAGIKPMDVIVEFAGTRVRQPAELRRLIERKPVGSLQPIRIIRDGEPLELEVTLRPADAS